MGRSFQTQPPLPIEYVRDALQVRPDGCLVWRERPREHFPHRLDDASRFNNQRAGGPAGFVGPGGVMLVRFQFEGRTRRIAATRIAWALHYGQWPSGQVKTKNGADDFRRENLQLIQRGVNPAAIGRSSLARRSEVDSTLIKTLAGHPTRHGGRDRQAGRAHRERRVRKAWHAGRKGVGGVADVHPRSAVGV